MKKALRLVTRPAFVRAALVERVAAAIEHMEVIRTCRSGTLIDVGANKGQFSLAFRAIYPEARIIAFEPLSDAATTFERIFRSDPLAAIHKTALSDRHGAADFFVATRDDSSSLLKPGTNQEAAFGVGTAAKVEVPLRRLGECVDLHDLNRPIFVKVDVQGGELEVLRGCDQLELVDYLYIELSYVELYEGQPLFDEVTSYLSSRGFELAGTFNQAVTEAFGLTQADFLFKRVRQGSSPGAGAIQGSGSHHEHDEVASQTVKVPAVGLSVVILTFNSEASIDRTLRALAGLSDDIHVVDSFSTDGTVAICRRYGAKIHQRPFLHYADQRNWAIDNLPLRHDWQLHVDADEELTPELQQKIRELDFPGGPFSGYMVGRKIVFFGRTLRFGGIARTWHYRLFRRGFGRCEERLYDQHYVPSGKVGKIKAFILDHQEQSLSAWTTSHNRWSDMEALEVSSGDLSPEGQIVPNIAGTPIERKRYLKSRYYRLPLLLRAFLYFTYRYLFLLGFADGRPGFIYHVLQGFWFRFLVDAKLYEAQTRANRGRSPAERAR
ncbi:MAG TPA: FkbM family methyltransferase [Sphingomicrobium sp.]|nr:FkbM family methyltransferase [Sphingomicrobium sp.]